MENEFDIMRIKRGKGFSYVNNDGSSIKSKKIMDYINTMRIPPAYKDVRISSDPQSKRYAMGIDEKGRKQYLYTKGHNEKAAHEKNLHLLQFARVLPKIKKDIDYNLSKKIIDADSAYDKLISTALKLVMDCNFRIGSDGGVDKYNSYGVSTLTKDHFNMAGGKYNIKFVGKKGVLNESVVKSIKLNNSLKEIINKNKNKEIFNYSGGGIKLKIGAADVNDYLKKYGDISTKNFRTWMANIHFMDNFIKVLNTRAHDLDKITHRRKLIKKAVDSTAEKLHHTGSICKKSYIVNDLWDGFINNPEDYKSIIMNYRDNGNFTPGENSFIYFMKNYSQNNNPI